MFGWAAERLRSRLESLKEPLHKSNLKILLRSYISMMLTITFFSWLGAFTGSIFLERYLLEKSLVFSTVTGFGISVLSASSAFALAYFYPSQKVRSRSKSIKSNLPFAINHMSAIASSKVPPYVIFKLLTEFREYGEVSEEARKIVRNVDVFGQDVTTAMKEAAKRTPSYEFEELLNGLISVEETGGNLQDYLSVQAEEAMFDYRQKREKYLETLSTYADFYTAVLIAAPLFLIAILAIMNMVGGKVMGMDIKTVMNLGVYLAIPAANTAFIMFIHLTQPEVV